MVSSRAVFPSTVWLLLPVIGRPLYSIPLWIYQDSFSLSPRFHQEARPLRYVLLKKASLHQKIFRKILIFYG